MPQFLKQEIYDRIFQAGIDVFYEKDYRSATMHEIAEKARIPVSLIYSYFKNKEELFDKIASSVSVNFDKIIEKEEQASGLPSEKYRNIAEGYILNLLEQHKTLVILMDKSYGTKYDDSKQQMIHSLQQHIKRSLVKKQRRPYHDMLIHILASNFAESILEVARHYESREFAHTMLRLVTKCYYEGVNSL
ncbi:MAG: TetR/AcrR family transcriptional regulator [Treponema sp.]|nr:TetR/AcrR family transcriptional regulator [Treponema sp.]